MPQGQEDRSDGEFFKRMKKPESRWVFAYGSLIWRTGFDFISDQRAVLPGFHRSLCIYSIRYRGTRERPGLVFGLVPGGKCEGRAFEVAGRDWPGVLEYLREREGDVYHQMFNEVHLSDGRRVEALTFVADEGHRQYAGRLDMEKQLELVDGARGDTGSNRDYILNTLRHFLELGIDDEYLFSLGKKLNGRARKHEGGKMRGKRDGQE